MHQASDLADRSILHCSDVDMTHGREHTQSRFASNTRLSPAPRSHAKRLAVSLDVLAGLSTSHSSFALTGEPYLLWRTRFPREVFKASRFDADRATSTPFLALHQVRSTCKVRGDSRRCPSQLRALSENVEDSEKRQWRFAAASSLWRSVVQARRCTPKKQGQL